MARKKKIEPIVLTKENLLYQPLSLAISGYTTTNVMQQNIVIGVLRKLKGALQEMKDAQFAEHPHQLELFETKGASLYKKEETQLRFKLHMKELGVSDGNYKQAFNEVCQLSDIVVYVPDETDPNKLVRDHLFKIIVDKENISVDEDGRKSYVYKDHKPEIELTLSKSVAEAIFDSQSRIYDFLDTTALVIGDKFPKRIYMYLSNLKYNGGVEIGYNKFRRYIGVDNEDNKNERPYGRFYDFKKRILEPSMKVINEMADKNMCDFRFTWEAVYEGEGRQKEPDKLRFVITLSEVGEQIKADKSHTPQMMELERRLREVFDQTNVQIRKLLFSIEAEDMAALTEKMDELERQIKKGGVKDKRAWANKILTEFVRTDANGGMDGAVEVKKEESPQESDNIEESKHRGTEASKYQTIEEKKRVIVPKVSEEDRELWNELISRVGDKWKVGMRLWEVTKEEVRIVVPNKFYMDEWGREEVELKRMIGEVFGDRVVRVKMSREMFENVGSTDDR